jgi:hypothetical protein
MASNGSPLEERFVRIFNSRVALPMNCQFTNAKLKQIATKHNYEQRNTSNQQ